MPVRFLPIWAFHPIQYIILIGFTTACVPFSPSLSAQNLEDSASPTPISIVEMTSVPTLEIAIITETIEGRETEPQQPKPSQTPTAETILIPTALPIPTETEASTENSPSPAEAQQISTPIEQTNSTLPLLDPGEVTPRPSATATDPPRPTSTPSATATRYLGVRIQTVGDSITEGGMYRLPLITLLNSTGCFYDMVGSRQTGWAKGWDGDHQGYGGATAYWLVDDSIGLGQEMSSVFAIYQPDIVLLHIGTNDLWTTERDPYTISEYVRSIIFKIRAGRPDTDIYLAQIIPGQPFDVSEYNQQLRRIAQEMTTATSPIILVDMVSNFDLNSDTSDGVHPNGNGGQKMATNWFNAMQANNWCAAGN